MKWIIAALLLLFPFSFNAHAQSCTDVDPWSIYRMDGWLLPFMRTRAGKLAREEVREQIQNETSGPLRLVSIRQVTFTDTGLGCPAPDEINAQVLTPGFVIRVEADGSQYQVHMSASSGDTRICEGPVPGVALLARDDLAERLRIPDWAIDIEGVTPARWSDASLGGCLIGDLFAAVITPGYRIALGIPRVAPTWDYHTDETDTVCLRY